jgi:hypothetical protein
MPRPPKPKGVEMAMIVSSGITYILIRGEQTVKNKIFDNKTTG